MIYLPLITLVILTLLYTRTTDYAQAYFLNWWKFTRFIYSSAAITCFVIDMRIAFNALQSDYPDDWVYSIYLVLWWFTAPLHPVIYLITAPVKFTLIVLFGKAPKWGIWL